MGKLKKGWSRASAPAAKFHLRARKRGQLAPVRRLEAVVWATQKALVPTRALVGSRCPNGASGGLCVWAAYPRYLPSLVGRIGPGGVGRGAVVCRCLGAYEACLPAEQRQTGKAPLQRLERKHLTLRTRLRRRAQNQQLLQRAVFLRWPGCLIYLPLLLSLYVNLTHNQIFSRLQACKSTLLQQEPRVRYWVLVRNGTTRFDWH